jgi:hypothetical protein
MALVKEIIAKVDVPATENTALQSSLRVYQLQAVEPDKVLEAALQLVVQPGGLGKFALDPKRKMVIVSADDRTQEKVEALLTRLEERKVPARPAPDVQVRIVWLVSGQAQGEGAPPPDDLQELLPGLAKLGILRPRLAAQTLVTVTPNTQFQAKGMAKLHTPCQFSVMGNFGDKKETPELEISLRATHARQGGPEEICNLQTQISAPLGHLVVLGVTPNESLTSVFVVQVLPKEAKPAAPRR